MTLSLGEAKAGGKDWLYALLLASIGDRPLGVQANQVAHIARTAKARYLTPVDVVAVGPRTSTIALVAAALVGGLALAIHLYAPELMHSLGHVIHGGR